MLIAILPMYFPMVVFIGIHFVMLLIGVSAGSAQPIWVGKKQPI